jgi:hypothetical protein
MIRVTSKRNIVRIAALPIVLGIATILIYFGYGWIDSTKRTYPQATHYQFISIHELKRLSPESGFYNTEGYVAKIFSCPSCPPGASCKPCMGDNIVISEQKITLDLYTLTDSELNIFVSNPKQFKLGMKYNFSIQIRDSRLTNEHINDVGLVGYSP